MGKWQRLFYTPNLPLGEEGKRLTACKEHIELSKNAAKEGMVLLKNEGNILPFAKGTKLALFGKGTLDYVKGGGGSGDVTVEYVTDLYEGLKSLNCVSIFEDTIKFYRKNVDEQYENKAERGMTREPELSDELCVKARSFAETAVITICRFSGEGWDRKSTFDKKEENPLFEDGDFYLSHAEAKMVEQVKKYFDKVVVVMNVGGMVDTEWFKTDEKISAVLMAWQGGMEGGRAAAELLCGFGNPCGKLSDTFAKRLEDYPSTYNFHESELYVDYTDDVYVGYRYFETIPGAQEKVNYPFGYGLSYTTFEWEAVDTKEEDGVISIKVNVTNTGKMAGKEVIQVYYSAPQGLLGKPAKELCGFEKTRLLQPGESQMIVLTFKVDQMASYDDLGKVQKSAYVLEKGAYKVLLGTSVRDVKEVFVYELANDKVVEQLSAKLVPTSLNKRMLADGSFEELPMSEANDKNYSAIGKMEYERMDGIIPDVRSVRGWSVNTWSTLEEEFKNSRRQFIEVAEGKLSMEEFLAQFSDEDLAHLLGGQPNTGVANTWGIGNMPEYGIPNVMTADGPAGLRIQPQCGVNTTAWPCATLLACTWNRDLVFAVGEAGGKEVKENNIGVWLTPAINIHRSPLCGRNFEYYSEDPFLAGKLASEMVKGMQSVHVAASVKHFAFNNKETNRRDCDSRVSERAAREIYLKAFEIIVKEADPWTIMSSYNPVNGHRSSECKDLITDILRGEWGFEGMVTTDWWTLGEHYKEVKAQNDLKMPRGFSDRLMMAKDAGVLTREEMEVCAKRVLNLILKMD